MNSRVSQIDFKMMGELHYGGLPSPKGVTLPKYHFKYRDCIQPGTVIFVDSDSLESFTKRVYPFISVPFVLVSGDSDDDVPRPKISNILLAEDSKVIHWYAQNCAYNPDPIRFTCIPLGLSQWNDQKQRMQRAYESGYSYLYPQTKNELVVVGFDISNNPTERQEAYDHVCKHTKIGYCKTILPSNYYTTVASSKFVLSPHGKGLDCYRTWEALFLGSYPIVKTSSLDILYKDLPVLIIKEWQEVTKELLLETYKKFQNQTFRGFHKLYNRHWYNLIYSHRQDSTMVYEYELIQGVDNVL